MLCYLFFFFSSRRRHTRWTGDWSSDVCSSDLLQVGHQKRRGDALPGNVRDAQTQSIFAEREDVEVIPADRACRLPGTRDFIPRQLRGFAGKELFLNGLGLGDLAFLFLKMMAGLFPGLPLLIRPPPRFTALPAQGDLFC